MTRLLPTHESIVINKKNQMMIDARISPTRTHQVYEDLLKKEKEFASLIYLQKDQDRYL